MYFNIRLPCIKLLGCKKMWFCILCHQDTCFLLYSTSNLTSFVVKYLFIVYYLRSVSFFLRTKLEYYMHRAFAFLIVYNVYTYIHIHMSAFRITRDIWANICYFGYISSNFISHWNIKNIKRHYLYKFTGRHTSHAPKTFDEILWNGPCAAESFKSWRNSLF